MEYTIKQLSVFLGIKPNNIGKALKYTPYTLKAVEGSYKKVKHYKLEDLPQRYKDRLKETEKSSNISSANTKKVFKKKQGFTSKYLLASSEQQEKALLKVKLCEYYFQRGENLSQLRFLEKIQEDFIEFDILGNISKKQLNDWLRRYKIASAKGINIIEDFIDTRGKSRKNLTSLSKEQQEMAIRYFIKQSHVCITRVYALMCHAFGETMPSYDTLNKFYKKWQKLNPQLFVFAKSPDKWKNKYQIALGSESEKAQYRNHYWELDATPADVICSDGKRYTILGLIDIATRRCVFTVEDSNSSYAVSRLLRKGILKLGIPENVVLDNGKEFVSKHFESICHNLKIRPYFVAPFSGEKKPFIERMFGTMARGLFAELPAFVGHNVAMKSEIQAKMSFAHKIEAQRRHNKEFREIEKEKRKAFSNLFLKKKENLGIEIDCALSKAELQKVIDNWVTRIYEQKVHGSLGKKPINAWNSYKRVVDSISDVRMLDLLLGKSYSRKVGKKGINIDGGTYWEDKLLAYMGRSVKIMTTDDMGEVMVYDPNDMHLICRAFDFEMKGQSREAATRAKKKHLKIRNSYQKLVKEAVESNDPSIFDVIDNAKVEIEAQTFSKTKQTAVTKMLIDESSRLEKEESELLEQSNIYDIRTGDKCHRDKRSNFISFEDKILFILRDENDPKRDEKLARFKRLKPKSYERAIEKYERTG